MTAFEVRKRDELHYKLTGFFEEMTEWRRLSDKHAPLKKHYTQVRALTQTLDALATKVGAQIDTTDDIRGQWKQLEREVVALHTVWGFYRDKWALRQLEKFEPYLILADEYTWAGYKAAQEAFARTQGGTPRTREPPLVFLGPAHGAWSLARGDSGQDDLDEHLIRNTVVQELVRRLPLPVVALPWHQLSHLPDAIVLGHEVGHLVVVDFVGLLTVRDLVDRELVRLGAGAQERYSWASWAEEAFADVYGVLCGGVAFAQTLGDVLIARGVENELADDVYPPPVLRLAVLAGAVEGSLGREAAASALEAWREDGIDVGGTPAHELAGSVGRALVEGPYPMLGGALTEVIPPLTLEQTNGPSDRLLNRMPPQTDQIRVLLASTVTAFRSRPDAFKDRGLRQNILSAAVTIQSPGFRSAPQKPELDREPASDLVEELWGVLSDLDPATAITRAGDDD